VKSPGKYLVIAHGTAEGVAVTVSLGIGHLLGARDAEERTTLAMESASHGIGLALTIAVLHFRPDQALQVLVPYLIVFTVIGAIYLRLRRGALGTSPLRSAPGDPARPSPASLGHRMP
jgi:predicted Na+-dependent transporter